MAFDNFDSDDILTMNIYLEARRNGAGPIVAAHLVKSTAADIERFARLEPEFAEALLDAEAEALERVEAKMIENAQGGEFQAGKFVLESQIPTKWIKPERELLVRLGQPQEIDLTALHQRLLELDKAKAIEVEEIVEDGGDTDEASV